MGKQTFDNDFRNNSVKYVKEHPTLKITEAAKNLGIAPSTLHKWLKASRDNDGNINMSGSGNITELEKKNRELERELKNTKDALEILKKAISILGN